MGGVDIRKPGLNLLISDGIVKVSLEESRPTRTKDHGYFQRLVTGHKLGSPGGRLLINSNVVRLFPQRLVIDFL